MPMASTLENREHSEEIDLLEDLDFPDDDLGLSDQQWQNINRQLDEAVKKGVISQNERNGAKQLIAQIPPNMRQNAEKLVEKKLKKKARFEQEYREKLEEAQKKGLLSEKEKDQHLKEYHQLSGGKKREKASKELDRELDKREIEQTKAEDIIDQSPHLSHQGKRTDEAEAFLKKYNTLDESGKKKEKLRLVNRLRQLEQVTEICQDREKLAGQLYRDGNYAQALMVMKRNLRFTSRYPDSPKIQEVNQKAEASITNLEYELAEQEKVRELREDRDDEISVENKDQTLENSENLIKQVGHMVGFTKSHRDGVIARDPKWATPHMSDQQREAKETHQKLENMYAAFTDIDQKDEQTADEIEDFRREGLASDKVIQAHAKAYADLGDAPSDEDDQQKHLNHHEASLITHEVEDGDEVHIDQSERILQEKEADALLRTNEVEVKVQWDGEELQGEEAEQEIADNILARQEAQIRNSSLSQEAKKAELSRLKEQRRHPGGRIAGALWSKFKTDSSTNQLITTGDNYNAQRNTDTMTDVLASSSWQEDEKLLKEKERESQKRKEDMLNQLKRSA